MTQDEITNTALVNVILYVGTEYLALAFGCTKGNLTRYQDVTRYENPLQRIFPLKTP